MLLRVVLLFLFTLSLKHLFAQDSLSATNTKLASRSNGFINAVNRKAMALEKKMDRQSNKYLSKLQKQESKLRRKLWKCDSLLAKQLFGDVKSSYSKIASASQSGVRVFSGHMDSVSCALQFLDNNRLVPNEMTAKASENLKSLQSKMDASDAIKSQLLTRQRVLQEQFKKLGKAGELKRFQKHLYYYQAQMLEYKEIFSNSKKLEKKILRLLSEWSPFQNFMKQNSQLAGLFAVPDSYANGQATNGLQTRNMVLQSVSRQMGGGSGPNAASVLAQQVRSARSQLDQYKEKLAKLGLSSGDVDMPNFKPNNQKTKSFFNRLEYGTSFQTTKSSSFFPTTTDLGLSIGYKINDKSVFGLGASYKLGLGNSLSHIALSNQGIGLRSYLDFQLKGNFFVSGGMELNYQKPYSDLSARSINKWQQSGLLGVSKTISRNSKVFKKTKLQLLWDVLSYNEYPQRDHFKFRIAYNFK